MENIVKISDNIYEIPQQGGMNVPGRIFADDVLIDSIMSDNAARQVMNVAHLPGIINYSMSMPDTHWGYGFPIGGVAAFDLETGVISPGGVGYDINCGVRVLTTCIEKKEIEKVKHDLLTRLFSSIPSGVGSRSNSVSPSLKEFKKVLRKGAQWAFENGFSKGGKTEFCEENGYLDRADPDAVSNIAIERGIRQLGTLGSGNHFIEMDEVAEIYDEQAAQTFGLIKGTIVLQIHTGSRGFGHQVCDDTLKMLMPTARKYNLPLPDRQLVSAPLGSPEAEQYIAAMSCAANFAWANRQIISHLSAQVISKALGESLESLSISLLYDVCHNIAKFEKHTIQGQQKTVCVHRKGATRAFPPGSPFIPEQYRHIGQPVIIPGDMGSPSYICHGTEKAADLTFSSTCHGAGRALSRKAAKKKAGNRNIFKELKQQGIEVIAHSKRTAYEEMPEAYKDSTAVVNVMHNIGAALKVARLMPLGVIKG